MMKKYFWHGLFVVALLSLIALQFYSPLPMVMITEEAERKDISTYVGVGVEFDCVGSCSNDQTQEKDKKVPFFFIKSLICEGPADKAGIRYADIVVAIDNEPLSDITISQFYNIIDGVKSKKVGEKVVFTIFKREGEITTQEQVHVEMTTEELSLDPYKFNTQCE